ncbi:MFS transporter [Paractinoplanes rishiriensis]|uniref:Sugar efflux transporter n=1 Tax=Paractinoplanes rishiriensis TaxID=1050105 RepID=A0A919JVE3_9ACTN|nr:MFS transporter [Actinoplanes rishiriensis]GIE94127.1 putative sugar efflux transporter [Actinoplanes rishiriensis]
MEKRRALAAVTVLSIAAFAFVTTELLPIGLLTVMAPDLDRSRSEIGLLVGGYAIVVVLASIPLTMLTKHVPRRRLLSVTLVVFALANAVAAAAQSYQMLAGARLITALTQALFWSVVTPAVGGLFPAAVRGRALALFATGPALAPVLGVPIGTWLGQQAGWRAAFAVMTAVGLLSAAVVAALLPSYPPSAGGAARATAPDRTRFTMLMIVTALGVTGYLTFTTYVTPFLLDVTGFSERSLAPLLFISGAAGIIGTFAVSRTLDRYPVASLVAPLLIGAGSLLALAALGALRPAAMVLLGGVGLGYAAYATGLQHGILRLAPGNTDLASALGSTVFNAGIAAGALIGGAVLPALGARALALAGGLFVLAAAVCLALDTARSRTRVPVPQGSTD